MTRTAFYIGDLAVGAPGSYRPGLAPACSDAALDRQALAFVGPSAFAAETGPGRPARAVVPSPLAAMIQALEDAFRPSAAAGQTAAGPRLGE